MNKLTIPFLAALSALVLVGTAARAQDNAGPGAHPEMRMERHHREGGEMRGPEEMLSRMTEKLGLDATQEQSVRNLMEAARPQFDSLRDRSRANRDALRDLDVNDPAYEAKLQDLATESGQLATEMTLLHGRLRADINAVLTPEQRQQLAEQMKSMGDRPWGGPRSRPDR
jgi:protein CpxP